MLSFTQEIIQRLHSQKNTVRKTVLVDNKKGLLSTLGKSFCIWLKKSRFQVHVGICIVENKEQNYASTGSPNLRKKSCPLEPCVGKLLPEEVLSGHKSAFLVQSFITMETQCLDTIVRPL